MLKKIYKKYFVAKYLTLLVTLININCLFRFLANKLCTTLSVNGLSIDDSAVYLFAIVLSVIEIFLVGAVICHIGKRDGDSLNPIGNVSENIVDLANQLRSLKEDLILKHRIYSFSYVTAIEDTLQKDNEIWIITGDLEEDSANDNLVSIIGNNLEKGVVYRYFITKNLTTGKISGKASNGRNILTKKYEKYLNTKLFFQEINSELIAPDIDVIIYNATDPDDIRRGFVCVEIGNDDSSYAYQELYPDILEDLINQLKPPNTTLHFHKHNADQQNIHKFLKCLSIGYDFLTVFLLAVLSFTKIVSWVTALISIIPAFIVWFLIILALELIDTIYTKFCSQLQHMEEERSLVYNVLNEKSLTEEIQRLIDKEQERVFTQYSLDRADAIIQIDDRSKAIWLLTDLSYDIASEVFSNWLIKCMTAHDKLICNILYTDTADARGREDNIEVLKSQFANRICSKMIPSASERYIWSKTYGMVLVQKIKGQKGDIYISLGTSESALFKKVVTTEQEAATVLGILKKLNDEETL